jgi:hypothetical protein
MAAAAATTLPSPAEAKITAMGTTCLGKELYDFQKEVIYALVYEGKSVLAVRKTGGGKTAVMIGAGLMMEGVIIIVEPLIALSAMQSLSVDVDGLDAPVHLDAIKRPEERAMLKKRLESITERLGTTLFLYTSPQALAPDGPWFDPVKGMIERGVVSLVVNDEAHKTAEDGAYFRPEFAQLRHNLYGLLSLSPLKIATLSMTATFTEPILKEYRTMLKLDAFDLISWGDVSRRDIDIRMRIETTSLQPITALAADTLQGSGPRKFMSFSNGRGRAMGPVLDSLKKGALDAGVTCDALPLTSEDTLVMKMYIMQEWRRTEPSTCMDLRLLSCTSTAEVGVDCPVVGAAANDGIAPSMTAYVQMMGRIGRGLVNTRDDPPFVWLSSINLASLTALLCRIRRSEPHENRVRQRSRLQEVLRFLFLKNGCWHSQLEHMFSDPRKRQRGGTASDLPPRKDKCPFCRREFGKAVARGAVVRELDAVFRRGAVPLGDIESSLYAAKALIWPSGSGSASGRICHRDAHRLVLQLVAAEILEVELRKSGDDKDGKPSYSVDALWALEAPPPASSVARAARRQPSRCRRNKVHESEKSWAGIELVNPN